MKRILFILITLIKLTTLIILITLFTFTKVKAENIYVFISFSMPDNLIKEYIQEIMKYPNGVLVLRGIIDNECTKTQRYENDCASMDLKNCILEKKQYLDDTKTVEQFTYKCAKGQLSTPNNSQPSTFNSSLSTINYQLSTISDNTAEFTHSVAMLMGAKELVNNFDTDNLQFLKGNNKKCSIKLMNFGNCCKGHSGFGQCNTEELQLLRNKKDGLCYYIGEYCCEREGATRICIRKKQSYCCYPSKLARIINVSARQQLHLGFGTAEHSICDGLTQEQIQQVDFSQIDFSEIYSDVSKSITIDSNFNQRMENAINDFYKK